MADIDVVLNFDAKTQRLTDAQSGLRKVSDQAGKIPPKLKDATAEAGKMGGAMKKMGSILGAIGIGAFLFDAVRRAAQASDAMNELNTAWSETIGLISEELDPAIRFVAQGLAGVMAIAVGLTRFIKENLIGAWKALALAMSGDFVAAFKAARDAAAVGTEKLLDQVLIAGERAAGISQAAEAVQSKILLEGLKARINNQRLSGDEQLALIDETEKESLRILRISGEFLQASKRQQAKRELEIIKETASLRKAARALQDKEEQTALKAEVDVLKARAKASGATWIERIALTEMALKKQLELVDAIGLATLESEKTTQQRRETAQIQFLEELATIERERRTAIFESERAAEQERFAIRQEDTLLNREERLALLQEMEEAELEALTESADIKGLTEFEAEEQGLAVKRAFAAQRRALLQKQSETQRAFFQAMIQAGANAAAKELQTSRNAGRALRAVAAEQVEALAKVAARDIAIAGAKATGRALASGGGIPFGIPFAVATAAFYAVLAGTVSAGGSALANKLRPPPVTDQPEPVAQTFAGPPFPEETRQRAATSRTRGAIERREQRKAIQATRPAKVGVAPGAEVAGGDRVTIIIQSLTGEINQEMVDKLEKALKKSARGRG